jgi:hypothetical protein
VWREGGSTLAGQGGYPLTLARTRSPSCGSLVHLRAALAPRLPPGGIGGGGAWPQRGTLTLAPCARRFSLLSAREGGEQEAPQTLGARASRVDGEGGGGGFLGCLLACDLLLLVVVVSLPFTAAAGGDSSHLRSSGEMGGKLIDRKIDFSSLAARLVNADFSVFVFLPRPTLREKDSG